MVQAVTQALFVFGNRIQVAAQTSITDGAVSGKNHVPSLPGQPPNQDTGVLANNIETLLVGPLHVEVQSKAPYAVFQEFGTSKMAERPYMRPALALENAAGRARACGRPEAASDLADLVESLDAPRMVLPVGKSQRTQNLAGAGA